MRRIATPSNYIKGFILFEKGYVTLRSGGFVEVKSEGYPDERPYVLRFFGGPLDYGHTCGATARNPDSLCKHVIAGQFSKFPDLTIPPHKGNVDVFEHYRMNGISSRNFDKDAWMYGEFDISDPRLADYLWPCLLARIMNKRIRFDKNAVEDSYEDLILGGKYLTAKLKSLISLGRKEDALYKFLTGWKGKNLGDIILEGEEKGIENAKAILYRAFKEDLIFPKELGEVYLRVYKHCSELGLVL
jgi:hypothetical protein